MRASADTTAGHGRLELLCAAPADLLVAWARRQPHVVISSRLKREGRREGEREGHREEGAKKKDPLRTLVLDLSGFIRLTSF